MSRLPEGVCCADGPHCEHQVPGMDEMREQYERRKPLHELARRTFNDTEWADHDVLDMLDTAVAAVLDAVDRVARGPVGLPTVLASADDVARVCDAAGLTQHRPFAWGDDAVDVLASVRAPGNCVYLSRRHGWDGSVEYGAPAWLLWQAIQAARSTS